MSISSYDNFPACFSNSRVETEDLKTAGAIYQLYLIIWLRRASFFREFLHDTAGPVKAPSINDEDFALGQNPVIDKTIQCSKDSPRLV